MLTYEISKQPGQPLYEQLYRCIQKDIRQGKLIAGEKLPSKRSLAQHLSISVATVENAYNQLLAEGYLQAKAKSGYYVAKITVSPIAQPPAPTAPLLESKTKEAFLNLRSNSPSRRDFPFSVWTRLMRKVMAEQDKQLLQATPAQGAPELRAAIASYLYYFRGMQVDVSQIVVGAGTEYLYNLLIQLLGRDNTFGVENPGYTKIPLIYRINAVPFVYIPLDKQGLSLTMLEQSPANILHISPSHQFPTGIVTPIGRRQELLQWASAAENRYIIEDDYDSEFRFSGKPIPSLQSIDEQGRVIYVNTFSKTIAPSMRISYMILPPPLAARFSREMSFYACTVPSFEQYTLAKFIQEGYFEQHINRMKTMYRGKRDQVISAIRESPLKNKATILEQNAGLHFLLRVQTNKSDQQLMALAAEQGILFSCLSQYVHGHKEAYAHHILVNYSALDCARLEEGFHQLALLLEE